MTKEEHSCDNVNCNHNNKGVCCLFNPDNCKYRQLQKENADLKCECRRCVYADSPCILSDYEKDKNGICEHFKDVFDELTLTNNECKDMREELKQRIRENQKLCEQIEKMKSCRSCKHDNHCNHHVCDKSLPLWELRR